jgi:hypothetical protein
MSPRLGSTSRQRQQRTVLLVCMFVCAVLYLLPTHSVVWATPHQSPLRQTIPTATFTPVPAWSCVVAMEQAVDYALSGMPDFDQRQRDWQDPSGSLMWTHCGPAALADVLWALDSLAEPGNAPPPAVSDGHALVSSFDSWDDHDAWNVVALVEDWAARLGTNRTIVGTVLTAFEPALQSFLLEHNLEDDYGVTVVAAPSFEQLERWVTAKNGVVLLLGFWEEQGAGQWVYLGGHYVALDCVEPANRLVAISDPFRDAWEAGEALVGFSPVQHPFPHTAEVHNDTQYVSHDGYRLVTAQRPGGIAALEGYLGEQAHLQNFLEQNRVPAFEPYYGVYAGPVANVQTTIDYAIVLSEPVGFRLYLPVILKGFS